MLANRVGRPSQISAIDHIFETAGLRFFHALGTCQTSARARARQPVQTSLDIFV